MYANKLLSRLAFAAILASSQACLLYAPTVQAATKHHQVVVKVVYHIDDASRARALMRNAQHALEADPTAKIVVVAHGKGIDFLLNDAKDAKGDQYEAQVAGLVNEGVSFRVCNNTLKSRKLTKDAVIQEASIVPSGVAEIARLEYVDHYAYLKP
jgi:intracellular sulfur oxidation DsrE/DsrF family protein